MEATKLIRSWPLEEGCMRRIRVRSVHKDLLVTCNPVQAPQWLPSELEEPREWWAFTRLKDQDFYSRYFWVDFLPQRRDQ